MKEFGKSSLNDFLEDRIVYRNLKPYADGLPSYVELAETIDTSSNQLPRKTDLNYAKTMVEIIKSAYKKKNKNEPAIKTLVYIGDTMINDGTAFQNIIQVSGWDGFCLICAENKDTEKFSEIESEFGKIYQSNRWTGIVKFEDTLLKQNIVFDRSMVLLMDMDKTMIGARGRNDCVIDDVRLEAAALTVKEVLNLEKDDFEFKEIYDTFNSATYHHFTKDNQDYLVYICILLRAGILNNRLIIEEALDKRYTLEDFLHEATEKENEMSAEMFQMHDDFIRFFKVGDPTPFKQFRRVEYLATTTKFLPDSLESIDSAIENTILITHEVYDLAMRSLENGVLTFGLSDKPDEASIPSEEQKDNGMKPLHQMKTKIVGEKRK